jgi:hypothetical protein
MENAPPEPEAQPPEVLAVGPHQRPPSDAYMRVAGMAHAAVAGALRRLIAMDDFPDDERLHVWTWHTALCTLTWDVGEAALSIAHSGQLRAGRTLNRSLFEYAIRAHYYTRTPSAAVIDIGNTEALVRRTVRAQATHGVTGSAITFFQSFFSAGTTKAKHPGTREMIKALVANLTTDVTRANVLVDQLDDEYSLSTAFAHGSQAVFLDVFYGPENQVHPRTRSLARDDELLRAVMCMVAMLAAFEVTYQEDFGRTALVGAVGALGPFDPVTTIARQNGLRQLFAIT